MSGRHFIAALLATVCASAHAEEKIYMVAKFDVDNTTYNQVVFFQDDSIDSLRKCNREVRYGRQGRWQTYQHITRGSRGFTYSIQYACVRGEQSFSRWRGQGEPLNQVFGVTTADEDLEVKQFDTYSDCVGDMNGKKQTMKKFCARASQSITN